MISLNGNSQATSGVQGGWCTVAAPKQHTVDGSTKSALELESELEEECLAVEKDAVWHSDMTPTALLKRLERVRREPTSISMEPLDEAMASAIARVLGLRSDEVDYAAFGNIIDRAVSALDESLPNGQFERSSLAVCLLYNATKGLVAWMAAKGFATDLEMLEAMLDPHLSKPLGGRESPSFQTAPVDRPPVTRRVRSSVSTAETINDGERSKRHFIKTEQTFQRKVGAFSLNRSVVSNLEVGNEKRGFSLPYMHQAGSMVYDSEFVLVDESAV